MQNRFGTPAPVLKYGNKFKNVNCIKVSLLHYEVLQGHYEHCDKVISTGPC